MFFRDQQYSKALEVFKSMDRNFWKNNYEYASYLPLTPITYTGTIPNANLTKASYSVTSKLLITHDVVNIENKITTSRDNEVQANAHFNLANVQYNTSYHGKAWMMFSYGKSSNEPVEQDQYPDFLWGFYNFWPNNLRYGDNYYMCKSASDNYAKGFALSANKEFKAKCLLGILTCKRLTNGISKIEKLPYLHRNKPSPYVQQLKNYQNTNSFKEAEVHCPDIREYLSKLK